MPSDSATYGGLAFFMTNALLKQDVRTLINSHLFCVDNLSDAEIREHLTRDGNPVGYEGQHILGYHWFAYPNVVEGFIARSWRVSTCLAISLLVEARRPVPLSFGTAGFR